MSLQHVVRCLLRCVKSLSVAVYHECSLLCSSKFKSTSALVKISSNLKLHRYRPLKNTYSTFNPAQYLNLTITLLTINKQ